jgi:hypothetical protein
MRKTNKAPAIKKSRAKVSKKSQPVKAQKGLAQMAAQAKGPQAYSVLLHYPDYVSSAGHETYLAYVSAKTVAGAISLARAEVMKGCDTIDEPNDLFVHLVTTGHIQDLK